MGNRFSRDRSPPKVDPPQAPKVDPPQAPVVDSAPTSPPVAVTVQRTQPIPIPSLKTAEPIFLGYRLSPSPDVFPEQRAQRMPIQTLSFTGSLGPCAPKTFDVPHCQFGWDYSLVGTSTPRKE